MPANTVSADLICDHDTIVCDYKKYFKHIKAIKNIPKYEEISLSHLPFLLQFGGLMPKGIKMHGRMQIGRLPVRAPTMTVSVIVSLAKTGGGWRAQIPAASPLSFCPRPAVAT